MFLSRVFVSCQPARMAPCWVQSDAYPTVSMCFPNKENLVGPCAVEVQVPTCFNLKNMDMSNNGRGGWVGSEFWAVGGWWMHGYAAKLEQMVIAVVPRRGAWHDSKRYPNRLPVVQATAASHGPRPFLLLNWGSVKSDSQKAPSARLALLPHALPPSCAAAALSSRVPLKPINEK